MSEALVRDVYAAFGRGDLGAVLAACSADVDWRCHAPSVAPFGGAFVGRDGAERCPGCGLVLRAVLAGMPSAPAHVGLYLGELPVVAPASSEDETLAVAETPIASPRSSLPPHERRWRLVVLVLGVATALAV